MVNLSSQKNLQTWNKATEKRNEEKGAEPKGHHQDQHMPYGNLRRKKEEEEKYLKK